MLNKYLFSYKSCLLIFDDNCIPLKFCHPAYSQISLKVPISRRKTIKTWQKRGWHHISKKEQVPFKGAIAFTIVRQIFAGKIQALIIVLALLQSIWTCIRHGIKNPAWFLDITLKRLAKRKTLNLSNNKCTIHFSGKIG